MKFLSNVLKTLSTLELYAEKKKAHSERYFKTFYSFVNLWTVLLQPEEKAKLKQPAYRSTEFQFFQQGVGKFIFLSKFKWGSFFVTADQR